MKSLYNKDDSYTDEALELDRLTLAFVRDLMGDYVKMGYSPRQIGQIMIGAVTEEMLLQVIGWNK